MSGFLSNIQALGAAQVSAQVSANNIANMNTEGFTPSRARQETGPDGEGVRVSSVRRNTPETPEGAPSGTSIEREMVELIAVERTYEANAVAVRAQDEMLGSFLDELA